MAMKNNSLHLLLLFVVLQFQISWAQEVKNIDSLLNLYKNQTLHATTRKNYLKLTFTMIFRKQKSTSGKKLRSQKK